MERIREGYSPARVKINYIDWAELNFVYDDTGPAPGGKFEIASAPFLRNIFEAFGDPNIRSGALPMLCAERQDPRPV